ncbi:MAG: hypothetical protein B6I34_08285 [Anaerolineaceae bacterium 4572_32.1]|nr:MAG: hypothetical protein B6I34_08285 [Anaerolineaceae bacterium 4572_32.1]
MIQEPIPDAYIDLSGAYLDAYNAIVEPDRVIRVSRYVLEHWSGLLDPIGFWLLAELRQRCRANAKERDKKDQAPQSRNWWRGKQSRIANAIHAGRKTVIGKLNDDHHPLRYFILSRQQGRRYSYKAGRSVPRSTRYLIAMDDPLTPAHQAALRSLLAVDKDKLPDRLQGLAALERGDLLELLQQQSFDDDHWLPAVGDVVRDIHGPHIAQQTADLCSKLNARITRPDLVLLVPWYFRDRWLPHLKHRLSLMILALRARCYYNAETGADRNKIKVNWAQLGKQLGIKKRQMQRLRGHPAVSQFYKVLEETMGRRPATLLIGMRREPLVPEDEKVYRQLLTQRENHNVDPETGQVNFVEGPEKAGHFDTFGKQPKEETGSFSHIREEKAGHFDTFGTGKPGHFDTQTSIALSEDIAPAEGNSSIAPTQENPADPDTDETPDPENQETKTAAAADSLSDNSTSSSFSAQSTNENITVLLERLGIQEPSRSAILETEPGCAAVAGWALYAATQPGLTNPTGYVIRQLLERESPPEEFDDLAQLPLETIDSFRRAARHGGAGREAIAEEQKDLFHLWKRRFPWDDIDEDDGLNSLLGAVTGGVDETTVATERDRASQWSPDYG